ncbi:hypothetical protein TNCV_3787571 [Trichonephila clavipes]|nr:hypothetical protein TNCV_3787571 [Trichonephila clavipes]
MKFLCNFCDTDETRHLNHSTFSFRVHQSGSSVSISPLSTSELHYLQIWDGGTLRVPFPNDVQHSPQKKSGLQNE